jgi:RHS repeat-associated protein
MPGSDNYSFSVPITYLPGRGLDASLSLEYNSSMWHKMGINGNRVHFDVNKSWPAPGFRLGYGYLENQNNGGLLLVDADGTRHQMLNDVPYPNPPSYITTDGSHVRANGYTQKTLTHTDGTQVYYGAFNSASGITTSWPTKITDRHGNYLIINYPTNSSGIQYGPRITSIVDTLGRYIRFYYDSNDNLVSITAPGYADGPERQEVRFFYETITDFTNKAKFASNVTVTNRPSSIPVIKHIYFPGTQSGYRYHYSPYGMIRQVVQLRGMSVNIPYLYQVGDVTSEGQVAATTTYDYPSSTPPAGLSSAPRYTHRTDDWAGRTSIIPITTFEVGPTLKITGPDSTISETTSDEFSDTTEIKRSTVLGTYVYSRTKLEWQSDTYGHNRRIHRVQTTIDAYLTAAKTKTVGYTYTDYNNIDEVIEYNFNTAPDTPGPILRRTKTTYVTDQSFPNRQAYIDNGLVHLPTSVKVFAGRSTEPISRTDYTYDGASLVGYVDFSGSEPVQIQSYDESYNPYALPDSVCGWEPNDPNCDIGPACPGPPFPCCPSHWECNQMPVFDPATAKRGNVTSVKSYPDAATTANPVIDRLTYDITGNIITESSDCCQQRNFTYTGTYQFSYPETLTLGAGASQMNYSAIYDYNTGALRSSIDENNQTTTLHYFPESLRLYESVRPDGGITDVIYFGDQLFPDPDASRMHSAVMTVTSLDDLRTIRNWEFSDGQGQVARRFGEAVSEGHTRATFSEYDEMGRLSQISNPYYAPYGAATSVNPTTEWTKYEYDPLGRRKKITFQDDNTLQTQYEDTATTMTDQAGKQRRQIADALGRIIQVDEPDVTGLLNQTTSFMYDLLDNVVKITQGTEQQRYFKYDSLSRLTHERQVELDAPHFREDVTGNNYWSRRNAYNSDSLLTDSWDARGIHTHIMYDGLNRMSQISYSGETGTITPGVTYLYDELRAGFYNKGRLTTITTSAITNVPPTSQAVDYDRMGRPQSHRQIVGANTYTLGYSYNLLGQLQSQTYHSGRVLTNNYDAAARLSSVGDAGQTYVSNVAYAGHGSIASETWGNGAVHTRIYNDRLQVNEIKLAVGRIERQKFKYQYGEVNVDFPNLNITPGSGLNTSKNTGQVAVIEGSIDGVRQWQQRFAYDKLGRLSTGKEVTDDLTTSGSIAWKSDYTYDRWGNRFQGAGQGGVPVVDTDIDKTRNRFITVGPTLMIYDGSGNLTIDQKFRGLQHAYDSNGRTRRSDATNQYMTSVYDGFGQRVQTFDSLENRTRHSIYDAFGKVVADYENGSLAREYLYSSGMSFVTAELGGGKRYILTDHQGSTRVVTNQAGQVTFRHDYRPFGEDIPAGVGIRSTTQGYSVANPLRQQFGLTERDSPTGLDHTWFRNLDSLSGRWTSPDPYIGSMSINDPQSLNRYVYVENNPVNAVDPTGLCSFKVFWECTKVEGEPEKCYVKDVIWDCSTSSTGTYKSSGGGGGGVGGQFPYRPMVDIGHDIIEEAMAIGRSRDRNMEAWRAYRNCVGNSARGRAYYNALSRANAEASIPMLSPIAAGKISWSIKTGAGLFTTGNVYSYATGAMFNMLVTSTAPRVAHLKPALQKAENNCMQEISSRFGFTPMNPYHYGNPNSH